MRIHSPLLTALTVSSLTLGVSFLNLAPAQASSLLGSTVNYSLAFNNNSPFNTGSFVVSSGGPEVNYTSFGSGSALTVNFGASTFNLGLDLGGFPIVGSNVAWKFTGISPNPGIIGVTQTGGPTALSINFTSNSISVLTPNFSQPLQSNTYSFSIQTASATTPEPSAIFGLGLIGLAAFASKRKLSAQRSSDKY
jgi:hypothetical protein